MAVVISLCAGRPTQPSEQLLMQLLRMFSVDKSGPWTLVSWSTLQETPGWGCRARVDSKHPTTTALHDERWTDTRFTLAPRTSHIPSTRNVCRRECAGACPPSQWQSKDERNQISMFSRHTWRRRELVHYGRGAARRPAVNHHITRLHFFICPRSLTPVANFRIEVE